MVDWGARIAEATDLETLADIDAELAQEDVAARTWRFKVVQRRIALQGKAARAGQRVKPVMAFAAAYGLPAPDGRRLHAYRLDGAQFDALQRDLAKFSSIAALQKGHTPALFVLWASEWFRRSYRGGMRRWEDLVQALGLTSPGQVEQNVLRAVTRTGLQQWQRPVFADAMMQYLATLAREGGFPAYAVADGGRGWARDLLAAIVGPLMGAPAAGEAEALDLAKGKAHVLPGVFNDAEFIQLCADLALAIVQVRREAEPHARAAGLPLAAWLGLNRPGWREALPISTGDAAADALVEVLMEVEAVSGSLVGVERMLLRDEARPVWREAVRIGLDGQVSGGAMAAVDGASGRLRAFAAGPMARHLPGELALFDPPVDRDKAWSARAARHARGIMPLPFACPVQLDLRAGEQPVARIDLPGGKPRRGQLLVATLEQGSLDEPAALRIIGSGSGSYRAEVLFLQVPANWAVLPVSGGEVAEIGSASEGAKLWRVAGGARLTDPLNDCYRVLCGQAADQTARIDLMGDTPGWAEVHGMVDLFVGAPHVSRNGAGELVWRQIGRRVWAPAPKTLPVGQYELGWRHDGIMLDRRRIAVLPRGADVRMTYRGGAPEYEIAGFAPVTIEPAAGAPVRAVDNGQRWTAQPQSAAVYRFDARIGWPDGADLTVSISYPGEASLARWNGQVLPHRAALTLDDLRDLVAISRGPMTLLADLRDLRGGGRGQLSWSFVDEMPMSAVADDIASLLLPASLDAELVLDMNDAINTNWHVRQFPLQLDREGAGFVASAAIADADVKLCGRAMADPFVEVCFGPYSLLSDANHRPATLPDGLTGDWLVFLRSDDRVLTRPLFVSLSGPVPEPSSLLAQAMVQPFGSAQNAALHDFLTLAQGEGDDSEAALAELIRLTAGLRGLPPVTFNVFKPLPDFPLVLAKMAYCASEAERDAIMGLAQALPFAWFLIPRACWDEAANAAGRAAMELLKALPDAPRFAMQMVEAAKRGLVERQPLLEAVFGLGDAIALEDAAQAFLRRARQRIPAGDGTRYRARLGDCLPAYFLRFDTTILDTLDAPCAAALAAKGAWTPTSDDIRHLKLMARTFPTWFSEAFAASVKE